MGSSPGWRGRGYILTSRGALADGRRSVRLDIDLRLGPDEHVVRSDGTDVQLSTPRPDSSRRSAPPLAERGPGRRWR